MSLPFFARIRLKGHSGKTELVLSKERTTEKSLLLVAHYIVVCTYDLYILLTSLKRETPTVT